MADKVSIEAESLIVKDSTGKVVYQTAAASPPPPPPPPPPPANVVQAGPSRTYKSLAAAISAAKAGDTIELDAGTYTNDFSTITKNLTIKGVGGRAKMVATSSPPNGKAILVTQADVVLQSMEFFGCRVPSNNGAGVRYESGKLTVKDSLFRDNQMGLLASGADPEGIVTVTGTEFDHSSGAGSTLSHNIYINAVKEFIFDNCFSHNCEDGHLVKSRAKKSTITNSRIYDETGGASYSIDLAEGGEVLIRGNTIQQSAGGGNPIMIAYGMELSGSGTLTVDNNTMVNDRSSVVMVANNTPRVAQITNNKVFGIAASQISSGPAQVTGTQSLASRPTLP